MSNQYNRHLILSEIGADGQEKIKNANILVIGCGGLACPALMYLASSGVGRITIIDADTIDISNLPRQTLFSVSDVGSKKVDVAKKVLQQLNPDVEIHVKGLMLNDHNVGELSTGYDVILDCTDNYKLRYLLSDAVNGKDIPVIYAALHKFEGQLSVFNYKNGPSYRDLFPDEEQAMNIPTCMEAGVYTILPGIIGLMQANEAMKIILGIGEVASGSMQIYNSLRNEYSSFKLKKTQVIEQG